MLTLNKDLTSIILIDQNNIFDIYYVLTPTVSPDFLAKNYFHFVFPLIELSKITKINYKTLYSRFTRKKSILTNPLDKKVFIRLCLIYNDFSELDYFLLKHIPSSYSFNISKDEQLKNVFGYLPPALLTTLFPWIDFSLSYNKFMYLPFLIPTIKDSDIYFLFSPPVQNYFDLDISIDEINFLYHKIFIGVSHIQYLKDTTTRYAKKLFAKYSYVDNIKGLDNKKLTYRPLKLFISKGDFIDYMINSYNRNISSITIDKNSIIPSQVETQSLIINPLRQNLNLRINSIKQTKKQEV